MRQDLSHRALVTFISLLAMTACDRVPSGTTTTAPSPAPGDRVDADVVRIVSELLEVRASELHRGIHLERDLKADDLDRVELVMELEDHFEISIPDEDADKLQTVGQVADYVRARKKK